MSGISSILGGNTASLNEKAKSTSAATAVTPGDVKVASEVLTDNARSVNEDRLQLSDRAQKLQQLKEEFFPGGYRSIKITPAFIERLREYGFLSDAEAEGLQPSTPPISPVEKGDKLGALSQFIERLSGHLSEHDPDNSLIAILNKADAILSGVDSESLPGDKQEIKSVIAELSQYRKSDAIDSFTDHDKVSLHNLEIALRVADKIGNSRDASSQINSYLSVLERG